MTRRELARGKYQNRRERLADGGNAGPGRLDPWLLLHSTDIKCLCPNVFDVYDIFF
ncbi:MAG: hypothetical protein ACLQAT_00310 [Candidatus Binataceae bacterium]